VSTEVRAVSAVRLEPGWSPLWRWPSSCGTCSGILQEVFSARASSAAASSAALVMDAGAPRLALGQSAAIQRMENHAAEERMNRLRQEAHTFRAQTAQPEMPFKEAAATFLRDHSLEECLYARGTLDAAESIDRAVLEDSTEGVINTTAFEGLVR
jgi:hypothetical protein